MPTFTSNFNFNKPNVNSADDEDIWGGQLNENWDSLDSLLLNSSDSTTDTKTTTYTIVTSDRNKLILADATGGAFTITLPPAATASDGFTVAIKKIDISSNEVTVQGDASEQIDGSNTLALDDQFDSNVLVSDGSSWSIKSNAIVTSVPDASETVKGIIEIATDSESTGGTETDKALVPSNFAQNNLSTNGFQRLPGGLIEQWGTTGNITRGSLTPTVITLPTPFLIEFFNLTAMVKKNSGDSVAVWSPNGQAISLTQFNMFLVGNSTGSFPVSWTAKGR